MGCQLARDYLIESLHCILFAEFGRNHYLPILRLLLLVREPFHFDKCKLIHNTFLVLMGVEYETVYSVVDLMADSYKSLCMLVSKC